MQDDQTDPDNWYSEEQATFGDRVAGARDAVGLSQAELARKLGIKLKTLRAWEEDERQWPEVIDWALFQRFVRVEHSYLAIDLDDEAPLEVAEVDESLLLETDQD